MTSGNLVVEYYSKHPYSTGQTRLEKGPAIAESLIMVEYIDEAWPFGSNYIEVVRTALLYKTLDANYKIMEMALKTN